MSRTLLYSLYVPYHLRTVSGSYNLHLCTLVRSSCCSFRSLRPRLFCVTEAYTGAAFPSVLPFVSFPTAISSSTLMSLPCPPTFSTRRARSVSVATSSDSRFPRSFLRGNPTLLFLDLNFFTTL